MGMDFDATFPKHDASKLELDFVFNSKFARALQIISVNRTCPDLSAGDHCEQTWTEFFDPYSSAFKYFFIVTASILAFVTSLSLTRLVMRESPKRHKSISAFVQKLMFLSMLAFQGCSVGFFILDANMRYTFIDYRGKLATTLFCLCHFFAYVSLCCASVDVQELIVSSMKLSPRLKFSTIGKCTLTLLLMPGFIASFLTIIVLYLGYLNSPIYATRFMVGLGLIGPIITLFVLLYYGIKLVRHLDKTSNMSMRFNSVHGGGEDILKVASRRYKVFLGVVLAVVLLNTVVALILTPAEVLHNKVAFIVITYMTMFSLLCFNGITNFTFFRRKLPKSSSAGTVQGYQYQYAYEFSEEDKDKEKGQDAPEKPEEKDNKSEKEDISTPENHVTVNISEVSKVKPTRISDFTQTQASTKAEKTETVYLSKGTVSTVNQNTKQRLEELLAGETKKSPKRKTKEKTRSSVGSTTGLSSLTLGAFKLNSNENLKRFWNSSLGKSRKQSNDQHSSELDTRISL